MTRMLKKKKKTHTHNKIFGGLAHHCFNTPGIQGGKNRHANTPQPILFRFAS